MQYEPATHARHVVAFGSGWRVPAAHASHASIPSAGALLPGEHLAGGRPPPAQKWPSGQSKHSGTPSISLAFANVPGEHVGASRKLAPSGQKSPGSHGLHSVAADAFWYDPAGHSEHTFAAPALGAKLPGLHMVGASTPVPHEWPAGQREQWAALVRLVRLE